MYIRFLFFTTFLFLFPLITQASVAGNVEYLRGEAWVERSGEKILLNQGDTVDAGDVVVTTQSGRVKLHMQDESKVFVGSRSRITIDNYEMRKGSLFSGSFNMLWGKVRFLVTKLNIGSSSFSVRTKTATIGVRGTQFAIMLDKPTKPQQLVPTTIMLFEGAVVAKSIKGQITNIQPGTIVRMKPNGAVLSRRIEKHDLRALDIEPLAKIDDPKSLKNAAAPGSPIRSDAKGTILRSRLDPTATKLEPTTATRLDPTANKVGSTTLISPTRLESATLVKDPSLSSTGTLGTRLPSAGTLGTRLP